MTMLRALLVEDDDVDATLFQECVDDLRGPDRLMFRRVDRLAEAIEHLQSLDVDVVLLDLGLPDSQGLETFRRLREVAPNAPVVVLTGTIDDDVARAAVEAGAQDFIGKDELKHVPLSRVLRYAVERHRMQRQLEASEVRFRTLVELADDAFSRFALEPEPRLEYVSPAIEAITGFGAEDLQADIRLFPGRVHPDDRAGWSDCSTLAAGEPDRVVYRWQRRDDSWAWLEERRTPILEHGQLVAVHGITRDVTALKQAEFVLQAALEQERAAVEKLRALDEMKTTFLQAVSHELRTPLTVIRGFGLTLQRHGDVLPTEQRNVLVDRLVAASARLQQLLTDLLDVDRLDRGLLTAERRPTDVGGLIRGVMSELDTPRHPISVSCQQDLVVPLDAPKVERIVENLVMNAVKHTPEGTPVYVVAAGTNTNMTLTVADRGPGIAPHDAERLFEPFAQGQHAGDDASPGTGIGLTLVARFAELHGGHTRIERTRGGGATFVVELPATSEDAATTSQVTRHPAPGRDETVPDADPIVAAATRQLLRATTAEEASGVLLAVVDRLGGTTMADGRDSADVLPLDLSLGRGQSIMAAAPLGSAAHGRLKAHLPRLLEDARLAAERCRDLPTAGAMVPPGFESAAVLRELLEQLADGDAVLEIGIAPNVTEPWAHVAAAAGVTRSCIRAFDRAFLVDPWRFVIVLPQASDGSVERVTTRVRDALAARLPEVTFQLDSVLVGASGGVAAYRALSERVDA